MSGKFLYLKIVLADSNVQVVGRLGIEFPDQLLLNF